MNMMNKYIRLIILSLCLSAQSFAGGQKEEALSANVASAMSRSVSDVNAPRLIFENPKLAPIWLNEMSSRLAKKIPDQWYRERLLIAIHYEAQRAGLDPQLVLSLIQVESAFRKYAMSPVGARGLMQVMPFWVKSIGTPDHNLFELSTNLRYGCTILRHYLDRENGNLFRALGRYNGSLGKATYPDLIMNAWRNNWTWTAPLI